MLNSFRRTKVKRVPSENGESELSGHGAIRARGAVCCTIEHKDWVHRLRPAQVRYWRRYPSRRSNAPIINYDEPPYPLLPVRHIQQVTSHSSSTYNKTSFHSSDYTARSQRPRTIGCWFERTGSTNKCQGNDIHLILFLKHLGWRLCGRALPHAVSSISFKHYHTNGSSALPQNPRTISSTFKLTPVENNSRVNFISCSQMLQRR